MSADARPKVPSLSVFFPAYNDSGTVASFVIAARRTAATLTAGFKMMMRCTIDLARLWVERVVVRRHRTVQPAPSPQPIRRSA